MKLFRFIPALAAVALVSLTSCGGDDNDELGEPIVPRSSIEQQKQFVAETASELMLKFNAEEQREVIELLNYIDRTYGYLILPGQNEEEEGYYPYNKIGRSNEVIDIATGYSEYTGIYEPSATEWVKVADSNDLIFRVNDVVYNRIEMTVTRSGSNTANVYDPESGDSFEVIVPRTVSATLTAGGKTMFSQNLSTTFSQSAATLTATETTKAANIEIVSTVNGNNSSASTTMALKVNGEQIISANGTLNGRNLCDPDVITNAVWNETFEQLISGCNVSGNVLNRMNVNGSINFSRNFFQYVDSYYDYGEYYDMTRAEAAAACNNAVTALNNAFNFWLGFNNTAEKQATVEFVSYCDDYGWDGHEAGYYTPVATIKFADGTTYTDELLNTGFDSVVNQWENLINSYLNLWN